MADNQENKHPCCGGADGGPQAPNTSSACCKESNEGSSGEPCCDPGPAKNSTAAKIRKAAFWVIVLAALGVALHSFAGKDCEENRDQGEAKACCPFQHKAETAKESAD